MPNSDMPNQDPIPTLKIEPLNKKQCRIVIS